MLAVPRGSLVTIEGLDGAGKSTLAHALVREIAARGTAVEMLREPGGVALSERIRASVPKKGPLIVAGDFNDWHRKASDYLADALGLYEVFERAEGKPARSYPAQMPVFTLDRIYVRDLNVDSVQRHVGASWSRLSDHVALAATLSR